MESLGKAQAGKLIIAKVNTDTHKRTAGALNVQAIPTMAVYKGGALQISQPGARMGAQLRAFVAPYL
ncbi:MAG: thioredoxin-like negative regulator of GroEL [Myxococcota bacterium]